VDEQGIVAKRRGAPASAPELEGTVEEVWKEVLDKFYGDARRIVNAQDKRITELEQRNVELVEVLRDIIREVNLYWQNDLKCITPRQVTEAVHEIACHAIEPDVESLLLIGKPRILLGELEQYTLNVTNERDQLLDEVERKDQRIAELTATLRKAQEWHARMTPEDRWTDFEYQTSNDVYQTVTAALEANSANKN
jgi:hypothetical protein